MSKLVADLRTFVRHLLKDPSVLPGFRDQFRPHERGATVTARNINAAFLIALTGERLSYPAQGYLSSMSGSKDWGSVARFYLEALQRIEKEMEAADGDQPVALSCLRLAVQVAALFCDGSQAAKVEGEELVRVGSERLEEFLADPGDTALARYLSETEGWDLFYEILDALERQGLDLKGMQGMQGIKQ